jgi:hypothetical protein
MNGSEQSPGPRMTLQHIELERRSRLRSGGELPTHPVLLPDAACRWPAVGRWTPDYFAERVGRRRVTVDGVQYTMLHLLHLIDRSTPADPAPYLRAQKLAEVFPELAGDLEPMIDDARPNWCDSRLLPSSIRRGRLPEILLGGRGAGFDLLHYDKDHLHAFISQLYGRKELFLFSPNQTSCLYPLASAPNSSPVNIHAPDLDRHPRFVEAEMLMTTLQPGETIFIPSGWWHTSLMRETSISVTWNLVDTTNWRDFAADTRQRVTQRAHPAVGAAFAAYGAVFGWAARTRDRARTAR